MKPKSIVLFFLLFCLLPSILFGQINRQEPFMVKPPDSSAVMPPPADNGIWPKSYGGMQWTIGEDVEECYDNGYLVTGCLVDYNSCKKMPILLKTDVNGNVLWEKRYRVPISYYYNYTFVLNTELTSDGGMISAGATTSVDECNALECYDVFIMKLNACGEKEWCKVFSTPGIIDFGYDIKELPDGSFISMFQSNGDPANEKRVWLMKLSPGGAVLWQKVYCDQITAFQNEVAFRMILTSDSCLLVSGDALYPNPSAPQWWYCAPFHLKTDWDGNELWAEAWAYDTADFHGEAHSAAEDKFGNYYTTAYLGLPPHPCKCDAGALVQTGKNGNSIRYIAYPQHLQPYHGFSRITSVNVLDTNLLFLARSYYNDTDSIHDIVLLSDTLGNVIKEKYIILNQNGTWRTVPTSDNKILMTAAYYFPITRWDMYLYKLDVDLEYALFDPRVLTYDYLCPHPISSDTVPLNCAIIVGIDEVFTNPQKSRLQVFPNPATDEVNIVLPECYTEEYAFKNFTVKTARYQWPAIMQLQITDLMGRTVFSLPWSSGATRMKANISRLPQGMYLIRITSKDRELIQGKLQIVR